MLTRKYWDDCLKNWEKFTIQFEENDCYRKKSRIRHAEDLIIIGIFDLLLSQYANKEQKINYILFYKDMILCHVNIIDSNQNLTEYFGSFANKFNEEIRYSLPIILWKNFEEQFKKQNILIVQYKSSLELNLQEYSRILFEEKGEDEIEIEGYKLPQGLAYSLAEHINKFLSSYKNSTKLNEICFINEREKKIYFDVQNVCRDNIRISCSVLKKSRMASKRIAIRDGDISITYEQMQNRIEEYVEWMRKCGIKKGVVISLIMKKSIDFVLCLLAIDYLQAVFMPIDEKNPSERMKEMIRIGNAKFIITDIEKFYKADCFFVSKYDKIFCYGIEDYLLDDISENVEISYIMFSSGSSGIPKGIRIFASALYNVLLAFQDKLNFSVDDVMLSCTSISFDIVLLEIFLPLICGGTIWLIDANDTEKYDKAVKLIFNKQVTYIQATPSFYKLLIVNGWKDDKTDVSVLCGGENLESRLASELLMRAKHLWNVYGPTETTIWSTACEITKNNVEQVPIGYPLDNTYIVICDELERPVPIGVRGEIYISGSGVLESYIDKNNQCPMKFATIEGRYYFKTGDYGIRNGDGCIFFRGRKKGFIKFHGYRVDLLEIENVLKGHKNVTNAAVVYNEMQNIITAYVVVDTPVTCQNLSDYVHEYLPHYIVFETVFMKELPVNLNGKVDLKILRKKNNPSEKNLTMQQVEEIFKQELELDCIQAEDNFFQYGLNSINMARIIAVINKFGYTLSHNAFFENNTIDKIYNNVLMHTNKVVDMMSQKTNEINIIQQGMYTHSLFYQDDAYKNLEVISIKGEVDKYRLCLACNNIITKYKYLKSIFRRQDKKVVRIENGEGIKIEEINSCLPWSKFVKLCINYNFDLGKDTPFRIWIKKEESVTYLYFYYHHILLDGRSFSKFLEILVEEYLCCEDSSLIKIGKFIEKQNIRNGALTWNKIKTEEICLDIKKIELYAKECNVTVNIIVQAILCYAFCEINLEEEFRYQLVKDGRNYIEKSDDFGVYIILKTMCIKKNNLKNMVNDIKNQMLNEEKDVDRSEVPLVVFQDGFTKKLKKLFEQCKWQFKNQYSYEITNHHIAIYVRKQDEFINLMFQYQDKKTVDADVKRIKKEIENIFELW